MTKIFVSDVERTGFKSSDRIVEIAGVIWDSELDAIVGEFETLTDASRDIPAKNAKLADE